MPIKISVLHPSFNRPDMAFETYKKWTASADLPMDIEYILSLDIIDSSVEKYKEIFSENEQKKSAGLYSA